MTAVAVVNPMSELANPSTNKDKTFKTCARYDSGPRSFSCATFLAPLNHDHNFKRSPIAYHFRADTILYVALF